MQWTELEYAEYLQRRGFSIEQIKAMLGNKEPLKKPKKPKYRATITYVDGICFRSLKEANHYKRLKADTLAGKITGFCMQPKFVLVEGDDDTSAITYSADFVQFNKDGTYEIVDTKGMETKEWKRTYKQFKLKYPGLMKHFTVKKD